MCSMNQTTTRQMILRRASIAGAVFCSIAGAATGTVAKDVVPPISPAKNVMLQIKTTGGGASLCIDNTGSKKAGAGLHAWNCNHRNANQRFDIVAAPKTKPRDNAVLFRSRHSGLCVAAVRAAAIRSARANQVVCTGKNTNLAWSPRKRTRDGWVMLRNRGTGYCLEMRRDKSLIGAEIVQRSCRKSNLRQYFRVAR